MLRCGRLLRTAAVVAVRSPCRLANTEVEVGKEYWWCACGRSKKQPYCDGSHKGTGITPQKFSFPEGRERYSLCQCKATHKAPFCDGRHKRLPEGCEGKEVPADL
eukprot:TRINITY_DN62130_c0_g1_i1.p4 TRINITY_DN62130_c0_g1~~TRINITY_DN62130_c0_g1_i1.p4  ORF type:complete len:105 (+),score=30.79 TRINITY_DN62130_c0_g1_i1:85-399(+)